MGRDCRLTGVKGDGGRGSLGGSVDVEWLQQANGSVPRADQLSNPQVG